MEIVVAWIVIAIVIAIVGAIIADNKGYSSAGWFFVCLLLPVAILILLALPPLKPRSTLGAPEDVAKLPKGYQGPIEGIPYKLEGGQIIALTGTGPATYNNWRDFWTAVKSRQIKPPLGDSTKPHQSGDATKTCPWRREVGGN
jgi:hypothetical protein